MGEETYFNKKRKKKRKTKKKKVENLYKILGTRSNIGQNRIKEKYIEKLREFPPETHPEAFQEIRRAYEILKDVNKRKQYDMMRKYGDKFEDAMDDVFDLISIEEFEKAEKLIDGILELDPENIAVKYKQAELFLEMERIEEFCVLMDEILEMADIEQKQYVLFTKSTLLIGKGYYHRALTEIEREKKYITDMKRYHEIRALAFLASGNFEDGWNELTNALPSIDNFTTDNLELLLSWLSAIVELEKWNEISKVKNYFRKIPKVIADEEELYALKEYLLEEAELYVDVTRYREAEVYMEMASQIDKNDKFIKERSKEIKEIVKLEKELDRSSEDYDLIPYVHVKLVDLFLSKYGDKDTYAGFLNKYPHKMMRELEDLKEDIAFGVSRIRKKYPVLYKEFKKEMEELFNESTKGLNREQRRALR